MAAPQLTPILQVAKDILTDNRNRAMHVSEIAKEAVQTNRNMGMPEEEFAAKITSALAQNIKTKSPSFIKPINPKTKKARKGYYKLKRTAMAPTVAVPKLKSPPVKPAFLGTAGEQAVASELLFWGFNVAKAAIDEGIDLIVETRPNTFRYVQVKTATPKAASTNFVALTSIFISEISICLTIWCRQNAQPSQDKPSLGAAFLCPNFDEDQALLESLIFFASSCT